jgi:hypothetical protein
MTDEERLALFRSKLKDLLDEYGHTFHQDGAFCTTYFVTAEFFDGDGQYWASTIFDDKSPIWHVTGLIQHALENDFTEEEEEED